MATNILMPALSPTMTEGTLSRWLKKEGENVRAGDVIAEIETDKATMEVEAVDEGVLGKILVADGTEGVKVNEPIAILVEPRRGGTGSPQLRHQHRSPRLRKPKLRRRRSRKRSPQKRHSLQPPSGNGHDAAGDRDLRLPARAPHGEAGRHRSRRAEGQRAERPHRARRTSRPRSRKAPAAAAPRAQQPAAAPVARPSAPITAPHQLVPHSNIRKVIARRLTEAKSTIPHFYVSMDVEIDAMIKLMNELNAKSPKEGDGVYLITINDLVIKASAATLRRVPTVNAAWTDEGMALFDDVDISVAVAIPDGLITPIIRKADQKGLATISREMKDLAGRARAGKLKPEEFQGGGFSISNMGMFGVSEFAAIINPPQAAILAVAAGQKRPVVKNDSLAIATVMTCTLSVDHRVVDGALGARWLREFKRIVEDPLSLLL